MNLNGNGEPTCGANQAFHRELSFMVVTLFITDDYDGVVLCHGLWYSTQIPS